MKKYSSTLLITLFLFTAAGSTQQATAQIHKQISPEQAMELIKKNRTNRKFTIIDVRTPNEYKRYHIRGSILIDYYSPEFISSLKKLDRNNTYLIYCRSSNRTQRVLIMMKDLGFRNVYEMKGGIIAWIKSGYAVE